LRAHTRGTNVFRSHCCGQYNALLNGNAWGVVTVDNVNLEVGNRLRQRRKMLALSQLNLAQASGVTHQQIQKYESGVATISVARLFRLAKALNVPVGYFFEGLARPL
jgi:DNA-binding XRE family transcriptional regulator